MGEQRLCPILNFMSVMKGAGTVAAAGIRPGRRKASACENDDRSHQQSPAPA